jgi:hypothetical protein
LLAKGQPARVIRHDKFVTDAAILTQGDEVLVSPLLVNGWTRRGRRLTARVPLPPARPASEATLQQSQHPCYV